MHKILVSACLLGRPVRYDGTGAVRDDVDSRLARWQDEGRLVPICPEVEGGLGVPRSPAEIVDGDGDDVLSGTARVVTDEDGDVTAEFEAGARAALELAVRENVAFAVLKARSPSCGSQHVYDGTFSGTRRRGKGVTAALLARHGFPVFSEETLAQAAQFLAVLEPTHPTGA